MSEKCCGCTDDQDWFASLSNLPLFTDTFENKPTDKADFDSCSVTFELTSYVQILQYRCKKFWRCQVLEEFCKTSSREKSRLVPSLREDLWFVLQLCLLSALQTVWSAGTGLGSYQCL